MSFGFGGLRESLVRDHKDREKLLGKQYLNLAKAIKTIKANQFTHLRATKIAEEIHRDINALKVQLEASGQKQAPENCYR